MSTNGGAKSAKSALNVDKAKMTIKCYSAINAIVVIIFIASDYEKFQTVSFKCMSAQDLGRFYQDMLKFRVKCLFYTTQNH